MPPSGLVAHNGHPLPDITVNLLDDSNAEATVTSNIKLAVQLSRQEDAMAVYHTELTTEGNYKVERDPNQKCTFHQRS